VSHHTTAIISMSGQETREELTLYTNPICPFAHRVLLTITEKGLSAQSVTISLRRSKPDWFVHHHLHHPSPALSARLQTLLPLLGDGLGVGGRYLELNPRGTVPTLAHGKRIVHESVRLLSSPLLSSPLLSSR